MALQDTHTLQISTTLSTVTPRFLRNNGLNFSSAPQHLSVGTDSAEARHTRFIQQSTLENGTMVTWDIQVNRVLAQGQSSGRGWATGRKQGAVSSLLL